MTFTVMAFEAVTYTCLCFIPPHEKRGDQEAHKTEQEIVDAVLFDKQRGKHDHGAHEIDQPVDGFEFKNEMTARPCCDHDRHGIIHMDARRDINRRIQ